VNTEGRPGGLVASRGRPSPRVREPRGPTAPKRESRFIELAPLARTPSVSPRRTIIFGDGARVLFHRGAYGVRLHSEQRPTPTPSTRRPIEIISTYLGRRLPRRRPPPLLRDGRLPRRPAPDVGTLARLGIDGSIKQQLVGPVEEGHVQVEAPAESALRNIALRRARRREGPDGAPRLDVVEHEGRALDDALDLRG